MPESITTRFISSNSNEEMKTTDGGRTEMRPDAPFHASLLNAGASVCRLFSAEIRPRAPFRFFIQGPNPYLINRLHHTQFEKVKKPTPSVSFITSLSKILPPLLTFRASPSSLPPLQVSPLKPNHFSRVYH